MAALFRGEDSHRARVGAVMIAAIATGVRRTLGSELPELPVEEDEG